MTCGEAIANSSDPARWKAAFEEFAAAFNSTWQHVSAYMIPSSHEPISNSNPRLLMDLNTPIAYALPTHDGDGLGAPFTFGVARWLGEMHNKFVANSGRVLGEDWTAYPSVDAPYFTRANCIEYDMTQIRRLITMKCVDHTPAGYLKFDYDLAQSLLIQTAFTNKPMFVIAHRTMVYISAIDEETGVVSASDVQVMDVGYKVPQVELSADIRSGLLKELTSRAGKKALLEYLQTSVSLLQITGGLSVLEIGETLLSRFLATDLQEPEAVVRRRLGLSGGGPSVVMSQVALKHIREVFVLVRDSLRFDPFGHVPSSFKQALDVGLQQELTRTFTQLDLFRGNLGTVISALKLVLETQPDASAADRPIMDYMAAFEVGDVWVEDLPWYDAFPQDLTLRNIVATVQLLQTLE
jgi:hypothetical protein